MTMIKTTMEMRMRGGRISLPMTWALGLAWEMPRRSRPSVMSGEKKRNSQIVMKLMRKAEAPENLEPACETR